MGDKNHRTPKIRRRWLRNPAEQVIPNRKKKHEEKEREAIDQELQEMEEDKRELTQETIEERATLLAYESGLGVSEWEAFVDLARKQLEEENGL